MDSIITGYLHDNGSSIVRFIDISTIPPRQTQGFPKAVVFLLPLSRQFILDVYNGNPNIDDEFLQKEEKAGELTDRLADYIQQQGFEAYSQSDGNNLKNGNFDEATNTSLLPHKTLARLAGLGFIGKNSLLVTEQYGCAACIGTLLTTAPIKTESYLIPPSQCGDCTICRDVCAERAILGNDWSSVGGREALIDTAKCHCALKCVVACPWTQRYAHGAPIVK